VPVDCCRSSQPGGHPNLYVNPGCPGSYNLTHTPWLPSFSWNPLEKLSLSTILLSAAVSYHPLQMDCIFITAKRTRGAYGPRGLSERDRFPRFINFASATFKDLDLLYEACDPATFGRRNEDVYDESYRKAVKMDASIFSLQLDLVGSGLMRTVEDQLLQTKTEGKYIRAELYKLNIYGKSCREVSSSVSLTEIAVFTQTRARSSRRTRALPVGRTWSGHS